MISPISALSPVWQKQSFVQKSAAKVGSCIHNKVSNFLELNNAGSLERLAMVALSFGFVLGPRYFKARDNHEKREVLTRDVATICVSMLAVPPIKKLMNKGLDKLTKLPTSDAAGIEDVANWYSKANVMPKKVLSLAENISNRKGDVAKAFSKLGEEAKTSIATLLNGAECNSENIMSALKNAANITDVKNPCKVAFDNLTNILSNPNNGLAKVAQRYKAIPAVASLAFTTALLGWGIPAFNIYFTRNKVKGNAGKQVTADKSLEPALNDSQQKVLNTFYNDKSVANDDTRAEKQKIITSFLKNA